MDLQTVLDGLNLASRYLLLGLLYYVFIGYPAIWYLRRRRR